MKTLFILALAVAGTAAAKPCPIPNWSQAMCRCFQKGEEDANRCFVTLCGDIPISYVPGSRFQQCRDTCIEINMVVAGQCMRDNAKKK